MCTLEVLPSDVNTNPENELVAMTSILGKREPLILNVGFY